MTEISLKDVRKSFGDTEVIHGVDLHVDDGEMIVIVGPSGCGKSTLLRMVAGLETVTSGKISIGERIVNDLEPMERDIAMVFQNYALYPHMNVFDNMAYGLKIAKRPKAEIKDRVQAAAKLLQLEDFLKRKPRQLSGGQRQRVAMGRAIVRKPSVFLFDEPLSNLDAKLRGQMRLEIRSLQRELGVTSLYVTHDQVEAMTLADRVVVMNSGVAEQVGAPLDVYHDPQTVFVAGFIGSPPMNFIAPTVFSDSSSRLPQALSERLLANGAGGAATVGIRPEHMALCESSKALLSGRLKYSEPLGAETLVHLQLANDQPVTVRQSGLVSVPAIGETCHVCFDPDDVCLFDESGNRLGKA